MKRIRRMLAFIVMVGILSGLLCSCGHNSEVPEGSQDGVAREIKAIKDSGYIKIGVFKDSKPFGYLDLYGEYQGFDVYFARRIGKDLGVKVQFVPVDAENREKVLETGEVDIVLAGYTMTNERSKVVDFATPYIKTTMGVVSSSQNTITNINELKDKIVIVVQDTTADQYLAENHPGIKRIRLAQYKEAFTALEQGLGDALCAGNLEILAWMEGCSDFVMGLTIPGTDAQVAPAVQKDNKELLDWMNEETAKLQQEKFFTNGYEQILQPIYRDTFSKEEIIIE